MDGEPADGNCALSLVFTIYGFRILGHALEEVTLVPDTRNSF